jgi:hypothetical protein
MYQTITSITGRQDDKQVLLVNEKQQEAVIGGIDDIDNACFVLISYLKAVRMTLVDIVSYSLYSVGEQRAFIIKFKRTDK